MDPDTRAPWGRHEPRYFYPVPQTVPPPANNTATYACICALFREQYHMSDDTSDRALLHELYLRPLAIDVVRRSHEPYHFSNESSVRDGW